MSHRRFAVRLLGPPTGRGHVPESIREYVRLMALRRLAVLAMTCAALVACGQDKPVTESTSASTAYSGAIDASAATISLKVAKGQLTGAVCQDERPAVPFDPAIIKNDAAELVHDGRPIGTVSISDDLAVGTVELAGKKHKFRAETSSVDEVCGKP